MTTASLNTVIHNEHALPTAAFLWTRGFKLRGVLDDETRPFHKIFQFEDDGRISDAHSDDLNDGSIPTRAYARAIAELKSLVHNGGRNRRHLSSTTFAD